MNGLKCKNKMRAIQTSSHTEVRAGKRVWVQADDQTVKAKGRGSWQTWRIYLLWVDLSNLAIPSNEQKWKAMLKITHQIHENSRAMHVTRDRKASHWWAVGVIHIWSLSLVAPRSQNIRKLYASYSDIVHIDTIQLHR